MNNEQKGFIINKYFENKTQEEIVKAYNKIWQDEKITESQVSKFLTNINSKEKKSNVGNNKRPSYSKEEERFLLQKRAEGLTYGEITQEFNKVFNKRTLRGIETKLHNLTKKYSLNKDINKIKEDDNMPKWEEEEATRKQKRLLISLERPSESKTQITKMIDAGIYSDLTKKQASDRIQALTEAAELLNSHLPKKAKMNISPKKQPTLKTNSVSRITKEESDIIRNHTPREAEKLTGLNILKIYAHRQHLKRKGFDVVAGQVGRIPTILQEETKTEPKSTLIWTNEQDFDILCNFYELSIDEARIRFNRTYQEIAGRLEFLFDSTQPEHIEMLMRASQVVNQRREQVNQPTVLTRRELRQQRKQQRKEAKQMRRISKLEKKMEKIRG